MRRRSPWFAAPVWLLTGLLFSTVLGHAQGKTDDIPLPDDPPVPALATPAPHAASPVKSAASADDIPLPNDPPVPPVSALAPHLHTTPAAAAKTAAKTDDIPLPDDPAVPNLDSPSPHAHAPAGHAATGSDDIPLPSDPAVPALTPEHAAPEAAPAPAEAGSDEMGFLKHALFAGIVVALLSSYLGLFVVARRMVFVGLALSELSSAGIALGVLLGFERGAEPLLFALGFMLLGVLLFSRRWAPRRVPHEAVIGTFYCLATALGILLIAKSARGETHLLTLLQGDILAVYPAETLEMAAVFVVVGIVHILFAKEFLLVSLDHDTASTMGFRAPVWDFMLFLTIGIAVSLSIRSVGVLMATSLLILPGATALLVAPRWNRAAVVAPLVGVVSVALGLWLSYVGDFPASAVTVAVLFALFFPALLWHSLRRS